MTEEHRIRLEDRREILMNSFGWGPFRDGLVQRAIDKIDAELNPSN